MSAEPESPYTLDPFDNFCAISGHQTLVLDDKLYITPGFAPVYISNNGTRIASSPWIRVIDLSQSFSLNRTKSVSTVLPTSIVPVNIPNVQAAAFWFDPSTSSIVYAQGVPTVDGGVIRDSSLRSFGFRGKSWTGRYDTRNQSFAPWEEIDTPFRGQNGLASSLRKVFDPVRRKGYIYGGSVQPDDGSSRVPNRQLLTYDAVTQSWTNGTTQPGVFDVSGTAVSYRTARGGLLSLIFGGSLDGSQLDMDTIFIHDTESNSWHRQRTNGPAPNGRLHLCATPITSADNSSIQVIMYGGVGATGSAPYSDIHTLSLPSFTWTRLEASSPEFLPGPGTRLQPTCNIINNHILAVFGGRNFVDGDTAHCDYDQNALFMYDLNDRRWILDYDASDKAAYKVPREVYTAIGGSESGGATLISPPEGFDTPELTELFAPMPLSSPTTDPTQPTESNAPRPSGSLNKAGIIGVSIGGILFLVATIFFIRWLFRRRQRKTNISGTSSEMLQPGIEEGLPPGVEETSIPIAEERRSRRNFSTPVRLQNMRG